METANQMYLKTNSSCLMWKTKKGGRRPSFFFSFLQEKAPCRRSVWKQKEADVMQTNRIILGCMRIANLEVSAVEQLIETALEVGVNFFDHADIYGGGRSEEVFAAALDKQPGLREQILIQTKCGIRPGLYDFSKEHIIKSVEGSLKRLNTEYVDALLLHRPDTLMEPEEVAEAFTALEKAGK